MSFIGGKYELSPEGEKWWNSKEPREPSKVIILEAHPGITALEMCVMSTDQFLNWDEKPERIEMFHDTESNKLVVTAYGGKSRT